MSNRYEVKTPTEPDGEGLLADEWEIHPSGALIFRERHSAYLTSFVTAYAPGAWLNFWEVDAE